MEEGTSTTPEHSTEDGPRLALTRRGGPGHHRSWARVSLGGLTRGRRRDKEPKILPPRSPTRRITLGGMMRGEGVGPGGASLKGRRGIRYEQTHSENWLLEDEATEEGMMPASLRTSLSMDELHKAAVDADGERGEPGTTSEKVGSDVGEGGEDGIGAESHHSISSSASSNLLPTGQQRQVRASHSQRGSPSDMHVDTATGSVGGEGPVGQVSPASDFRRGSVSPALSIGPGGRARTQSWNAAAAATMASSPPVLHGPFSRARSRSRSPRHRMSLTLGGRPGGLGFQFARKVDLGRFSSGGGEVARTPGQFKAPSVASTAEDGPGWGFGDGAEAATAAAAAAVAGEGNGGGIDQGDEGEGEGIDEEEEEKAVGPFTETALELARLRLPHMELGFEEDGFFGVDVRSLIIGREIARGAYGVVHEAKLLRSVPENKDGRGDDGGGGLEKAAAGGAATAVGVGGTEADTRTEAEEGGGEGEGEGRDGEGDARKESRGVAVKIQQVPEDEEEQANLLGELAMLRNHKHSQLVEFIGTAMAVERGSDTVMMVMELCTNGALREALKLDISWPLKVRIASDMTDGLQYLHQHGIIHRDIKTPNVLIDGSWRAKLCDYNFAIDETSAIKQEFCAGTAEFMSPEVLLSEDYGLPSDVFSLGMIFVEMLTGREPSATFPERPPQTFFVVNEEEIERNLLLDHPPSFSLLQSQCLFSEPAERPTAEDAFNWLQDMVNETGEENIILPQSGPPLPVLTEGAAIAREGNVINASPKGAAEHPWFDIEALEQQVNAMVESAVDRIMAEREAQHQDQASGGEGGAGGDGGETSARLDEMKEEINALRAACEERDSRISDLEVQALRNTSTLKMLSSALEVAYKMLESQQAVLAQPNSISSFEVAVAARVTRAANEDEDDDDDDDDDDSDENEFEAVEARLSRVDPNS